MLKKTMKKFIGIIVISLVLSTSNVVFADDVTLTVHTSNKFMTWRDSSQYILENDEVFISMTSVAELLSLSYSGKDGNYEVSNGTKKANLAIVGSSTISIPTKKAKFEYVVPLNALCKFYSVDYKFDKTKNIVTLYGEKQADLSEHQPPNSGKITTNAANTDIKNIQLLKDNIYYYDYGKQLLIDLLTGEALGAIPITHYDKKTNTYLWAQVSVLWRDAIVWKYDKDFNKIKICDGDLAILEDGYAYVNDNVNFPPGSTNTETLIKIDLTGATANKVYKIKGRSTVDMIQYKGSVFFGSHPDDPDKPNVSKSSGTDKVYITSGNPKFKIGNLLYLQRYRKVGSSHVIDIYTYNLDTAQETKVLTGTYDGIELQKNGDLVYTKDGKLYRYSKGKNTFITNLSKMETVTNFIEDENYYYFSCFYRVEWKSYVMRVNKKDNKITKVYISTASGSGTEDGVSRPLVNAIILTADRIYIECAMTVYELDRKTGKKLKEYPKSGKLFICK